MYADKLPTLLSQHCYVAVSSIVEDHEVDFEASGTLESYICIET